MGRRAADAWWSGDLDPGGHLPDVAVEWRVLGRLAQHRVEHLLYGKCVSAATGRGEQVAVAVPVLIVQVDPMAGIIPGEGGLESLEPHPIRLVRVAHRLLDLAHDARL